MSSTAVRSRVTAASTFPRTIPFTSAPTVIDDATTLHDLRLESGERIDALTVRYRLEGTINASRDNLALVIHSLTGDAQASTWWKGVVGAREAIDSTTHAVLCASLAGSPGAQRADSDEPLPRFTTRDQATVLARLLDTIGVRAPRLVIGGSLGGMVALEFAASFPERVNQVIVLAAPAAQTAQGIAWNAIMRRAIDIGGAQDGLALARMVGMLSYRTPDGLERRFGRSRTDDGRFQVESWLSSHGDRLVSRFESSHYAALIDAMDAHDVGRGRGGICAALAPVRHKITGVGIVGDLLYPAEAVREWTLLTGASYEEIASPHGHDAFLLETGRVSSIVRRTLSSGEVVRARVVRPANTKPPVQTRALRIAVAGCGHVGGALLQLLSNHAQTSGRSLQIVRVLARDGERIRPGLVTAVERGIASNERCITDPAQLLDGDIDILVEAIGGTGTAATLVEAALRRGIRVVTANKALLALHGAYLQQLATSHGTTLDFEAAVAGAVPVVRCLRAGAAGVQVTRVSGILNGTSNYVLDQVSRGHSLSDAIREAQLHGYAEADPTRDLSGEDVEDKVRILAWLGFGVDPASVSVVRRGIDAEIAAWAAQVATEGDRVKLIATCEREGDKVVARIVPTRVAGDDPWAQVAGPANRIVVESESAGALVFHGAGAGGVATAGAIVADLRLG